MTSRQESSEALRRRILDRIDEGADEALALARWMSAHPELALEERETSQRYLEYLGARSFSLTSCVAGMETAFLAAGGDDEAPLSVALLAEMDALPVIGHACGHNLSGPASLLAASALTGALEGGQLRLVVVGCPAEEIGVGKRRLVESGPFSDIDAAMMPHASDMRRAHRLFLCPRKLELVFQWRAFPAPACPGSVVHRLLGVIDCLGGLLVKIAG